ncbi:hypothetical protein B5M42_012655 [Paenibacillus athensensis]|uniref:hypothetical protein n=1 Tax=Paenibacillus athensensis TaxID=1967502 RepID=UPI001E584AA8|nr:hypothetical protein [Paenibacillus athensensis]MCD1259684.1 hypothetical protein [Paenibacillus athensensis]
MDTPASCAPQPEPRHAPASCAPSASRAERPQAVRHRRVAACACKLCVVGESSRAPAWLCDHRRAEPSARLAVRPTASRADGRKLCAIGESSRAPAWLCDRRRAEPTVAGCAPSASRAERPQAVRPSASCAERPQAVRRRRAAACACKLCVVGEPHSTSASRTRESRASSNHAVKTKVRGATSPGALLLPHS